MKAKVKAKMKTSILQDVYMLGDKAILAIDDMYYLVDFNKFRNAKPRFYKDGQVSIPSNYSHVFDSYKIINKMVEFYINLTLETDYDIMNVKLCGKIDKEGNVLNWFDVYEDDDVIEMYLDDEMCSSTSNIIDSYLRSFEDTVASEQRRGFEITRCHYLH